MMKNDSFNELVFSIVNVVTEPNKKGCNPILIYCSNGDEKTYLLNVVENGIKEKTPGKKVLHITTEGFAKGLADALHKMKMKEFKDKFRSADVLIMDDLQFLQGKAAVQEAFFYMFNDRYEAGKKMIFGCNCNPMEMENISGQILNRITNGLVIELVREKRN